MSGSDNHCWAARGLSSICKKAGNRQKKRSSDKGNLTDNYRHSDLLTACFTEENAHYNNKKLIGMHN